VCNRILKSSLYQDVRKRNVNSHKFLIPILLTWRIWWAPNNASSWQMGFNWTFKELISALALRRQNTSQRGWILLSIRISAPVGEWTPVTQVAFTVHLQVSIDLSDYGLIICTQHWRNQCGMFDILTSKLSATNRYVLAYRSRPHSVGNVATISAYLVTFYFDSIAEICFEENKLANCENSPAAVGGAPIFCTSRHS